MFKKLFNLFFGASQEKELKRKSYHESLLARIEQQERNTKRIREDNEKISRELDEQIEMLDSLVSTPEPTPMPKRKTKKKKNNT